MLILDKPRPFDGSTITLPLYHRGHLSLFPGAKVWLCLLPASETGMPEIVVSPIHHDNWSDLWRISITLHDRTGLVHDIFKILADRSMNIIGAESTSLERQHLYSIEIMANAKDYSSLFDGTHADRSSGKVRELKDLRKTILARILRDIAFLPSNEPRLTIRRVQHLFDARRAYESAMDKAPSGMKPVFGKSVVQKLSVDQRVVDDKKNRPSVLMNLPREMGSVLQRLRARQPHKSTPMGQYLMVSDTTDRFLRIYFVEGLIAPAILHEDEIGALAAITGALHKAKFNILTTLARQYRWGEQAHTEFVLQTMQRLPAKQTTEKILESALSAPDLSHFKLRLGYPDRYVGPIRTKRLHRDIRRPKKTSRVDSSALRENDGDDDSTEKILAREQRALTKRIRQLNATPEDLQRFKLVSDLIKEEAIAGIEGRKRIRNLLFVSTSFHDQKMLDKVRREAKAHHFEVITAKELAGQDPTNRKGIVRLIKTFCTHFLGVWTDEGSPAKGMPSSWLYWELGVAETANPPLRFELLISDKLKKASWERLVPEKPHTFYSGSDFETQLRKALKKLQAQPLMPE